MKNTLDSELESAKQQTKKKLLIVISFFLLSLTAVIIYLFFIDDIVSSISQPQKNTTKEKVLFKSKIIEVKESNSENLNDKNDEYLKLQYEKKLEEFEKNFADKLAIDNSKKWKKNVIQEIIRYKNDSLNLYSQKLYKSAVDIINKASLLAKNYFSELKEAYDRSFKISTQYFKERNVKSAAESIAETILINETKEARELKRKILKLPEIIDIEQVLSSARGSDNFKKELIEIEKILVLLANNKSYIQRKKFLDRKIKSKRLDLLLEKAHQSFENDSFSEAKKLLKRAKIISPNNVDVNNLKIKITGAELNRDVNELLKKADNHKIADQWKERLIFLKKANTLDKENDFIKSELTVTKNVVRIKSEMVSVLEDRTKLLVKKNREKLRMLIEESDKFKDQSKSLVFLAKDLEGILKDYSFKLKVQLSSDGKSKVIVRRVGIVGSFESKVIQLDAGYYTLEASRPEFKSKSLDISVDPQKINNLLFDIRADERIYQ